MSKKKLQDNKQRKQKRSGRRSILRVAALLIIMAGVWLISVNLYHFIRSNLSARIYNAKSYNHPSARGQSSALSDDKLSAQDTPTPLTPSGWVDLYTEQPSDGDLIGELSISKIDAAYPIYEGTEESELDLGVGHYINSVLPGENDNCVLSGHRNTVFERLDEVEEGDSLIVTTSVGTFEYVVQKIRIVDKDDRTVIVPKPTATLTVSTCYPFVYAGPAPQRYILVAYLKNTIMN
jgi:sortase A